MRSFVSGHPAASVHDFIELALGTPPELWLGVEGESEQERTARLDAARDILAENPDLPDEVARIVAQVIEAHGTELFNVVPLVRPVARRRVASPSRPVRRGGAVRRPAEVAG
ncbi:hypothetical protein [Streptomyces sp. ICBB 8177]|uniref:hypothetical protein n=1 Tax=Streptomyces sp. ICBB 8177 TaxID=563922 RepID=UPI000D678122|nr:hypothetical protein [Streptomyces sp. ICBB 8177]PWI44684.1 hypothetical protein CK485_08145 [Streptomyces sp. ICBB 8177]